MKVLIVGCGAVGQVLGHHLQQAGDQVGFYARPSSAARLQDALEHDGLPLFQLSHRHKSNPVAQKLAEYQVLTGIPESVRFAPDQIWFTTPSPVYYSEWFRKFLLTVPSKWVVCFAPEAGRVEFIPKGERADRFVFGGITFIAWQGDLAGGGGRPEGVNYWLPPLLEMPVMGSGEATGEVVEVLRQAGLRAAQKNRDYYKMQAALTAAMTTFMAGLELSGWSLAALRRGPWLRTVAAGGREAVFGQLSGANRLTKMLLGITLSRVALFLGTFFLPLLFPFRLEAYLSFHYQKTRTQTLALLAIFMRDGKGQGLPVQHIQRLLDELNEAT